MLAAGCSADSSSRPTPAATVTQYVERDSDTIRDTVDVDSDTEDELADLAFSAVWGELSPLEQQQVCGLYLLDSDLAWDSFTDGAGTSEYVTRSQFDSFFIATC